MKLQNAIRRAKKATGSEPIINHGFHRFEFNGEYVEFSRNGGTDEITCICTASIGQESDSMTDYFPQVFHDNLTQALRSIGA